MKKWLMYVSIVIFCCTAVNGFLDHQVKAEKSISLKTTREKTIIRHIVQENDVFVECMVPGVSFTGLTKGAIKGKIVVFVDGLKSGEYHTAAFIMKDMPKGAHRVKVEVLTPQNKSLGISKAFYITIS